MKVNHYCQRKLIVIDRRVYVVGETHDLVNAAALFFKTELELLNKFRSSIQYLSKVAMLDVAIIRSVVLHNTDVNAIGR